MAEQTFPYRGMTVVINQTGDRADITIDDQKFKATRVKKHGEVDMDVPGMPEHWASDGMFVHLPLTQLARFIADNLQRISG